MDVRVTACTIDMVVNSFSRASLSTTSRNMLGAHLRILRPDGASSHRTCWVVHVGEATAVFANISVSTSAIRVVDFGATCAC